MSVITYFRSSVQKNIALRSVGVYTSVMFLNKGISFLLLFIYTNPLFITPSENGLLNLFSSSILFLMPFLSMGILQSASTDFYKLGKEEFRNFFISSLVPPSLVFLLSCASFFFLRDYLQSAFGFPYLFFILVPLITFLNFLSEMLTVMMRVNQELRNFARVEMVKILLEFGLSIALVVFFAMRWKGRLVGITVSYTFIGIYAFYYFRRKGYLSGKFDLRHIKNELLFAIPVILMQVSIFCLNTADKFFLAKFQGHETVGIYGVACIFATVITVFASAYLSYLSPVIYRELSRPVVNHSYLRKNFRQYALLMGTVSLLIVLLIPVVYRYLINARYGIAVNYFYLIAAGYFIWSLNAYFYSYLFYHKARRVLLLLSLGSIAFSVVSVYYFSKNFGAAGAALGILISYVITFGLTFLLAWRYVKEIFNPSTDANG